VLLPGELGRRDAVLGSRGQRIVLAVGASGGVQRMDERNHDLRTTRDGGDLPSLLKEEHKRAGREHVVLKPRDVVLERSAQNSIEVGVSHFAFSLGVEHQELASTPAEGTSGPVAVLPCLSPRAWP